MSVKSAKDFRKAAIKVTEGPNCSICGTDGECDHLLLVADITFRVTEGGALDDVFSSARWAMVDRTDNYSEAADDTAFDKLLEKVESIADAVARHDFDSAMLGNSSAYRIYYSNSAARREKAVEIFKGMLEIERD